MRHVVGPLASSTYEAPSLKESGEQDQRQENEPHVHTAASMIHLHTAEETLTDYAGKGPVTP